MIIVVVYTVYIYMFNDISKKKEKAESQEQALAKRTFGTKRQKS